MRDTREELSRSRVVVEIKPRDENINILDLRIRNIGASVARNVTCRFKPDLKFRDGKLASKMPIFDKLPFLAPNSELSLFFDSAISYFGNKENATRFEAEVSYEDAFRSREDRYEIDLDSLRGLSISQVNGLDSLNTRIQRIERILSHIESFGLLVKTPTDIRAETEEMRKRYTSEKKSEGDSVSPTV